MYVLLALESFAAGHPPLSTHLDRGAQASRAIVCYVTDRSRWAPLTLVDPPVDRLWSCLAEFVSPSRQAWIGCKFARRICRGDRFSISRALPIALANAAASRSPNEARIK